MCVCVSACVRACMPACACMFVWVWARGCGVWVRVCVSGCGCLRVCMCAHVCAVCARMSARERILERACGHELLRVHTCTLHDQNHACMPVRSVLRA